MIASIVLLPTDDDIASLRELSEAIMGLHGFKIWPHITMLQFETDRDPQELVELAEMHGGLVTHAQSEGLTLLPSRRDGSTWVELLIQKTERLISLQCNLLAHKFFSELNLLNGTGDSFRPHITMGRYPTPELEALKLRLDPDVVRREFRDLKLKVAVNDAENFTLTRLIG